MSQIQEMPAVHDTHTSTTDTDTGQFAQTRQPDDLFDDDFTPVSETVSQFTPPHGPRIREPHGRTRNERPSRGRGRGHADRPLDSLQQGLEHQPHPTASTENNTTTDAEPAKPPTIGAVRGNRLQTGGVQKPKLTEDELSARLEAAKINNARREEAHRLAEADEASFQHREAQAREKRREEGVARKVMEGEREKNRLRKLGARGGREWDEGKKEEDFSRGRGGGYRRGMHGSVGYDQARNTGFIYEGAEEQSPLESGGRGTAEPHRGGPGRRGRGQGRGGRGRGRGGYDGGRGGQAQPIAPQTAPAVNAEEEFPSLSSANVAKTAQAGPSQETMSASQATEILKSPTGEKASWADQVDAIDAQTPAGGW
ncbi:hypothetical protein MMC24_001286 [Lignoscripta atroalba]|nr:hypothetical protein [Lignoscripta atroalba]